MLNRARLDKKKPQNNQKNTENRSATMPGLSDYSPSDYSDYGQRLSEKF